MDAARWNRVAELFHQALEHAPPERAAFLASACAGDLELRQEVEAMLEADARDSGLILERGVPEPLPAGNQLGAYRIEALIAQGGMGEVYRARRADGTYDQTVAIKVLRPGYQTAEAVHRFRLERQVLARLVHPDIAAILDGGTTGDGRPYLVLQYVDGLPITRYAAEQGLPPAARIELLSRVARVVQFAHGHLVVHRDLKPSNIFVLADGSPRLLDFGIAKLLEPGDDGGAGHATHPETRLLTPEHAAPEQLRREPVTTATDVYGLGILLYELLTGRRPFVAAGQTPAELERVILEDDPPAPSTVAPDPALRRALRGDLDRITLMALRKEPERRYGSAGEFADDLDRYLAGLPVRAERDTVGYRARKFAARNRGWLAAAAAALILLAGFVASLVWQNRLIAQARDRAEAERATAEDVVRMVTDLFQQSNPEIVPGGDTMRVAALVDRAEQGVEALRDHPERQAQMWRVLGEMRDARGQYQRAALLLRRSLQYFDSTRGRTDPLAAKVYFELAQVVNKYEGSATGRAMLDTALVRLRAALGERDSLVALALYRLSFVTEDMRVRQARLDSAIQLQRLVGVDSVAIAGGLDAQGHALLGRGRAAEALASFEGSLRILEHLVPEDHPYRLTETNNVAAALRALGVWSRAESLARKVLAINVRKDSAGEAVGWDQHRLALILANQGRLAEAEGLLREALARIRSQVAPSHSALRSIRRDLAVVIAAQGRVSEGLALLDSIVREVAVVEKAPMPVTAYFDVHRAKLLLRLGRLAEAESAIERAEPIILAGTPLGHAYRDQLQFVHGLLAVARGDPPSAVQAFTTLREETSGFPGNQLEAAELDCALGIALTREHRVAESRPLLAQCPTYGRWGLAEPLLLRWYQETAPGSSKSR